MTEDSGPVGEGKSNPASRNRILHITFNMGIGGTEQVIRQLVSHLPADKFENRIICIDGLVGDIGQLLAERGIQVEAFKRKPGFDWALIAKIRQLIRSWSPKVIHCHQYTPYLYGWLASLGTRSRVIFTEHGRFYPDRYRYKAFLVNAVMARLTYSLVAISVATREALVRYEFMPRSKIRVIYNGLRGLERDPAAQETIRDTLEIPRDAFVVGTVARLDVAKNQTMMLRAFKLVLAQHGNAYLLMVGDGPERQHLEYTARELGISDKVRFTGFIKSPQNHLAAMDVFLLSSHTEGTSMTLLEAMSLAIPAVATNVGGNPEIVAQGRTGILTPPGDETAFADAILSLARDRTKYQLMAAEAKNLFTQRFSDQTMIESYERLYERA